MTKRSNLEFKKFDSYDKFFYVEIILIVHIYITSVFQEKKNENKR